MGNENFRKNYSYGPKIDKLSFGEIRKCLNKKTNTKRAVKIYDKRKMEDMDAKFVMHEV